MAFSRNFPISMEFSSFCSFPGFSASIISFLKEFQFRNEVLSGLPSFPAFVPSSLGQLIISQFPQFSGKQSFQLSKLFGEKLGNWGNPGNPNFPSYFLSFRYGKWSVLKYRKSRDDIIIKPVKKVVVLSLAPLTFKEVTSSNKDLPTTILQIIPHSHLTKQLSI